MHAGGGSGRRHRCGAAHHAVLCVQHVGISVVPLEERPVQPQALQLLILDHRPQLLVVPKKNHLEGRCGSDPQTQRHPARPLLPHLNLPSMRSLHPGARPPGRFLSGISTCLTFSMWEKFTRGMRVSGSVAMPASSTKICRTFRFLRLGEAAHEHVQRMTLWRSSSNFLALPRIFLYLRRDAVGSPRVTQGPPRQEAAPRLRSLPGEVLLG